MAGVDFNEAFFEELGRSPAVTALCVAKANQIAATAKATAPVDSGDYRDRIGVQVVGRRRRNTALVVGADEKTMLIESKTGNLVRALNQVKKSG